ncbi:hypothetical protein PVAP13_3KG011300 [Panicum virgatum]|uniref:Uncharacterized protein n=1 Tax=Panicum virgatum TaxID=38727 RepID=A0A8T0UDS6_PANVG|nr:hypothetical protein PVAP13_3KG011300 [Panicum virgatum]
MGSKQQAWAFLCCSLVAVLLVTTTTSCKGAGGLDEQEASLFVDSSKSRQIPQTLFGIFFEEINHAGSGGLWAELVSNRGVVSCFTKNTVALRMEVLCDNCPPGGVGIYNPGFWGMNIEEGKTYNLVMYIRSSDSVDLTASLTCSKPSGVLQNLASASTQDINVSNWTRVELQLLAQGTCRTARLELTTSKRGVLWLDQVSLMPSDTYKVHCIFILFDYLQAKRSKKKLYYHEL